MADVILDNVIIGTPVADETARLAIDTGALGNGALVTQQDTKSIWEWDGSAWNEITPEEGTVTQTWGGVYAAAEAGDVEYHLVRNQVTLSIPTVTGTSTTAAIFTATAALPENIRPSSTCSFVIQVKDSGTEAAGILEVDSAGIMTIGKGVDGGVFTYTGVAGFSKTSVTYTIA